MPTFTQLQQKADFLPYKLHKIYTKSSAMSSLFCFPLKSSQLFQDAYLIQNIAKNLNYYRVAEVDKLSVLRGIYLYTWQQYDSAFSKLFNQSFINILSAHLEIDSLADIDSDDYEQSYQSLSAFCSWVYINRFHSELDKLYQAFPNDMQANITMRHYRLCEDHSSVWGCTIATLLQNTGINKLF